MAELGDCFEFGRGTDINYEEALNCYEQALEQGFTPVEEAIDRVHQKMAQA
jgi:TPR repeat protein